MDDFHSGLVELLPRLRRFARVLRPHDADAQDLVQQTVERALANQSKFRAGTRLDSWAFTLMRRLAIDDGRVRRRWSQVVQPQDDTAPARPDPAQADEHLRADALAARQAIHALPDDQRQAVALVLIEGLSYAEAAQVLDIPAGTLTSRLVRGRQTLLQVLTEQGVTA